MKHNILLTGASGYIGGTILARWQDSQLRPYDKLYALVRKTKDAEAVKKYGAEPLTFDASSASSVLKAVTEHRITIVVHNVDAFDSTTAVNFIKALASVRTQHQCDVHFVHSSGAKLFSNHAGAPQDDNWPDDSPDIYQTQKSQKATHPGIQHAVNTNNTVVDTATALDVRSYIVIPCIVYGKGEGFGNLISIQTQAIVKVIKALGKMVKVTKGNPKWPVSHIGDTAQFYISLINAILSDSVVDSNQAGYYLVASGTVAWNDLYETMTRAMVRHSQVKNSAIIDATEAEIETISKALGCPKELVELQIGGNCTLTAVHGEKLGWTSQYAADHILDSADVEVVNILAVLDGPSGN